MEGHRALVRTVVPDANRRISRAGDETLLLRIKLKAKDRISVAAKGSSEMMECVASTYISVSKH